MKKTLSIISITFGILYFILSFVLTIPGMGMQSMIFINSVKKQITNIFPKGKYVLEGKDPLTKVIMESTVKNSYTAAALSAIDYKSSEYNRFYEDYKNFTNDWFEKSWQSNIDAKENIDFYDIGMNIIKFDIAIVQEFQSYGYVNTGIQWIFHKGGIKELFSSEFSEKVLRQQTIVAQEIYEEQIKYKNIPIEGLHVKSSPGVMLVNNEVWFLNQQIQILTDALEFSWLINPFENNELNSNDVAARITLDDLYHPNFTMWKNITAVGFIMFMTSLVITPVFITTGAVKVHKLRKDKGK